MSGKLRTRAALFLAALCLPGLGAWYAVRQPQGSAARAAEDGPAPAGAARPAAAAKPESSADPFEHRFLTEVRPFLDRYCVSCHGPKKQKGSLDLSRDATVTAVANDLGRWELVLERLRAQEMPPESAARQPEAGERAAVVAWIGELRDREAERRAGDPGPVLARRLSNAEFDYTIHDLTGVDIRP